jgi:RNA polymerase sigma-70 factor, ECF subfamily
VCPVKDPDQEIVDAIRAGNTRRYAALVDRHKDRALTLALRLVGDREEAEELVQDGFLRAYDSLGQFRGDARFGTWFYRILYNLCMTRVTRRRDSPRSLDGPGNELPEKNFLASEEPGALERLEETEMQNLLSAEVARLPENFRIAVTLFYVQELSYEEMAGVTGLPLGTIKTNLFRGRTLLRKNILTRLKDEVRVS